MKIELTEFEAIQYIMKDPYSSWTYGEARALLAWYEEYNEATGEQLDLDPVSIRCEWSSYKSLKEINRAYGLFDDDLTLDELREHTEVIVVDAVSFGVGMEGVYSPASILVMDF